MLVELSIENLGVIERVHLLFGPGFTAVTGETGAGKTMLVEAMNLIVGRRADAGVVRDGAREATVEARFVATGIDGNDEEIVLSRVVSAEGGSRAYVNGRMSTVSSLAEIGAGLVDIHGQHEHQRLLSGTSQRNALDAFARVDLSVLNAARDELTEIDAHLAALGGDERSRAREIDLLRFQCSEIEGARLSDPKEDDSLDREESALSDVDQHREALGTVAALLLEDEGLLDRLGQTVKTLGGADGLADLRERLELLVGDVRDVGRDARERAERIEADPLRLEEIRVRRQVLRDLRKKYGDSIPEIMSFGQEARARLDELEGYSERVAQLEDRRDAVMERLQRARMAVGNARRAAAPALGSSVEKILPDLGMPAARLSVAVGDTSSDPGGDSVAFMFTANPGSQAHPLSKVASGGELARVMLALRLALTEDPAVMVFDEVDAGIGGAAAVAVARALRQLGVRHQVLAVTHLPQVAAAAHSQVQVAKSVRKGRTFGSAQHLDETGRVEELARMLSGGVADDSAVAHARDLLDRLSGESSSTQ